MSDEIPLLEASNPITYLVTGSPGPPDFCYVKGPDGSVSARKNNLWLSTTVCECGYDLRSSETPWVTTCPQCGATLPWREMVTTSC